MITYTCRNFPIKKELIIIVILILITKRGHLELSNFFNNVNLDGNLKLLLASF